jgi:hypothetical protein
MPPLVDSDIFCKLGVAGLLEPSLAVFGVGIADCFRLPALPSMLRRGAIPKMYGAGVCADLIPVAMSMRVAPTPSTESLAPLVGIPKIDPGEAQLFACAAERSLLILTADKRSLTALAAVTGFSEVLVGRIVTLEALLLTLCDRLGVDAVRTAVQPLLLLPKGELTVKVCFSPSNRDPRAALVSYFNALKNDARPLVLWEPPSAAGGGK